MEMCESLIVQDDSIIIGIRDIFMHSFYELFKIRLYFRKMETLNIFRYSCLHKIT